MDDVNMRPGRALWWSAGLLALAVVVAIGWIVRASAPRSIRLADGSSLIFREVNIGTNCQHSYGSFVSRLGELLPAEFARFFPRARTVDRLFFETNIVFWLERTDSAIPRLPLRFTLSDERGSGLALPAPSAEQPLAGDAGAFSVATPIWPRDAGSLVLRVFDAAAVGSNGLAGEWRIRNPRPSARVSWAADAMPVPRPTGEVIMALEQFEIRPMPVLARTVAGTNLIEPMGFMRFAWTNANAAVITNLRPRLVGICVSDTLGNRTPWEPVRAMTSGNRVHVSLVKLPWAGDRRYRVSTRWAALDRAAPRERLSVQVLLLTRLRPGETGRTVGKAPYRDSEVRVTARTALAGSSNVPGAVLSADIRRLTLPSFSEYQVDLVSAVDAAGRRWRPDERGEIEVPGDLQSVAVEVEVGPLTLLEFTAEPVRRARSAPERTSEKPR